MGRTPCCAQVGLKKGRWTAEEDEILTKYIHTHGEGSWKNLPKNAGLLRCGKSCRLRWMNYLRLDLRRGNFCTEEEELIIKLHALLGNRWSQIAARLPGRTDNEIKNYWNTHLSRKLGDRGIDPVTHKPFYQLQASKQSNPKQISTSNPSREPAVAGKSTETEQTMSDKSDVISRTYKRKKNYQDKGAPKKKNTTIENQSSGISCHSTLESCSEKISNEAELIMQSQDCNFLVEEECVSVHDEHLTPSVIANSLELWDDSFSSTLLPSKLGLFESFDSDDFLIFDNQLPISDAPDYSSYNVGDTTDDLWSSFFSNMESFDSFGPQ